MAEVIPNIQTLVGGEAHLLSWFDEPDGEFYIFTDGILAETTTRKEYTVGISPGSELQIEIFDDINDVPTPANPGNVVFSWNAIEGATSYRIDKFESAAWELVVLIPTSGSSTYRYQTVQLEDSTQHTFRVVPIDSNDGLPRELIFDMVRVPDRPVVTYDYDDVTGIMTVTEVV